MNKIFWCKNCLNMSTRPRISFDERGWCNACQWMDEKKTLDWSAREAELSQLLDHARSLNRPYDCLVPVSGGKDGSYVAWELKHRWKVNPLTVTIKPSLALELGNVNLENFKASGFNHLHLTVNPEVMDPVNKMGFIEKGFPYYGWLVAIFSAVTRVAVNFKVPLIFWGESGEIEYGGSTELKNRSTYDVEYMRRIYLDGGHSLVFDRLGLSSSDRYFFDFPSETELQQGDLRLAHYGYFDSWDPYRNYLVAKRHCGLEENRDTNTGTFTNFAQNDQALYALHTYLMYLKFGFGRATQDAGIEIRRGAMSRDQALQLVRLYDGTYPKEYLEVYLNYYKMSQEEFDAVIDRYANNAIFTKKDGYWKPKFTVGEEFVCE